MPQPLLAATSIRKSFAGVRALKGVTFELKAGEVHALVGENGAGKSTLIKIMTGAERADGGTLSVDGAAVDLAQLTPSAAHALGIAVIYQQPALFPDLSVTENIALSLESTAGWRPIQWRRRRERARQLLERAGATFSPDRIAGTLSMPEQQLVEIARAIGADARVILMDEPTASLTDREVVRLFEVIGSLRGNGAGIIYISHRLDEVFGIADRITVLRDGETIVSDVPGALTRSKVVHLMAGRELDAVFPKRELTPGAVALEVQHLSCAAAGLHDISFSVRRGEVLGIAGLVGSGRTELAEVLFGLRRADEGTVHLKGARVTISSPADAIRHGLAYVPEDRRRHGVVGDMPLIANTSLAVLDSVSRRGLLDEKAERELADRFVEELQIKTASVDVPVRTLSGGNQQKVALARWLATNPDVLILDEPTQGVDVGAKAEIHAVMQAMTERGMAILMISSELPEILGMSDRIVVMRQGRIAGRLKRTEATSEVILALALADASDLRPVEVR
jgi:rhamnose transport system ATP-binding protein